MRASELQARIAATVPGLAGRIETAADLSELVRRDAFPQASPFAWVLPLGLRGRGDGEAGAGAFTQMVDETFGVILFLRASGDMTGGKSLPGIDALAWAVIEAVCGWGPEEAIGTCRISRGALLSLNAGAILYQLDFALQQQIRILA